MKSVIAGGRNVNITKEGEVVLHKIFALYNITTVANGMCPTGVDKDAYKICRSCNLKIIEFPADWDTHGKAAGPIRNSQMIKYIYDGILIIFKGGKGTDNIHQEAIKNHIPVIDLTGDKYGNIKTPLKKQGLF